MKKGVRSLFGSLGKLLPATVVTLVLSGCTELKTEYGRSTGTDGEKSVNGFGVLREVYRRQGWDDRTVARLSERLNNVDAIIWTPASEAPPSQEVIEWFEEWLARGDKTLIYVLRDYRTEAVYWRRAADQAAPAQRVEYRRRVARTQLDYLRKLLERPSMIANGWFTSEPAEPPEAIGKTSGPWSSAVGEFGPLARVEYRLREFKEGDQNTAHPTITPSNFSIAWNTGTSETDVEFQPVLETEGGSPVVTRVSDETWNGSQILVIAGGSLLNNFGLIDPASQRLAMRLMDASDGPTNDDAIGFLYSNEMGVMVSSLDPEKMGPTGLEMLTAWPLNLVTIHAAILGLVVCLMLLPIFGRPRRLASRSKTDFAIHIDAVASLMARTSDEAYARARISDYMTRVRGETEGPWVLPDPADAGPAADATKPLAISLATQHSPVQDSAAAPAPAAVDGAVEYPSSTVMTPEAFSAEPPTPAGDEVPEQGDFRDRENPIDRNPAS